MALNRTANADRPPREMVWNGTAERAHEIDLWARNSALVSRWQWRSELPDQPARVLVETEGESAVWEIVPVGATIERHSDDEDAPLVLVVPNELLERLRQEQGHGEG